MIGACGGLGNMRIALALFCVTTGLICATAAPSSRRLASASKSKLSQRDRQLLQDVLCILKGSSTLGCLNDDLNSDTASTEKRQMSRSNMEEVPIVPGGLSVKGLLDRRDAFYSDWRRRK